MYDRWWEASTFIARCCVFIFWQYSHKNFYNCFYTSNNLHMELFLFRIGPTSFKLLVMSRCVVVHVTKHKIETLFISRTAHVLWIRCPPKGSHRELMLYFPKHHMTVCISYRMPAQQTRVVGPMLGWCSASVVDACPTSAQLRANASCLLG